MYIDFNAGGKDYKLRMETRNIVTLEKFIKGNPLSIFGNGDEVPSVTTMVTILWQSLQKFHHGISLEDTYTIFDSYLEDHSMTDFLSVIIDIYKTSGLIRNDAPAKEETTEKNA